MPHLGDPILDAAAHGGGEAERPENLVGKVIVRQDGTKWVISLEPPVGLLPEESAAPVLVATNIDTGQKADFGSFVSTEEWTLQDKRAVVADENGNFLSDRPLTQSEYAERTSLPEDGGAGTGGAGRAPATPDYVGIANAWMRYYETQVAVGQMPREQAEADWDRKLQELNAIVDTEIAQGTFDQSAAIAGNTAQAQFDANQLRQQEEFGRRSESLVQDFLPNFVPGLTGMNIPGVTGTIPTPQVDPNQIYGLGSLAGAGPTAPQPIPTPQLTQPDFSQFPSIPNFTPPPVPNIPGFLGVG